MARQKHTALLSKKQLDLLEAVESNTLINVQNYVSGFRNLDQNVEFSYILLVAAFKRGNDSITQFLMKKGWSVKSSQKTRSYCTPLYYAIKNHKKEICIELWRRGASITDTDANKESALELAMCKDRLDIIKYVLDDISSSERSNNLKPDCDGDVALFHAACWSGHSKAIQMFLSRNFSMKSRSSFVRDEWKGFTPLHFILESGFALKEAASIFLERNDIDLHAQDKRGRTCLHLAFRKEYLYLYQNDAVVTRLRNSNDCQSINLTDEHGLSHFHLLCCMRGGRSNELLDLIKHFIASGVDVNSSVSLEDEKYPGVTALHLAIQVSYWEVSKLLLESGADPTRSLHDKATPLHMACFNINFQPEHVFELVKLLLHYGADPDAKDSEGQTPLHVAFYSYFVDVRPLNDSERLILSRTQKGSNRTDQYGVSYLHIACRGNDLGVIESLLANGAPINSCTKFNYGRPIGYSPLHFAVESQQVNVVEFLLAHGADPKCTTHEKVTPLHLACRHSHRDLSLSYSQNGSNLEVSVDWLVKICDHIRIIELLVESGASVDAEDLEGNTPISINYEIPGRVYLVGLQISDSSRRKKVLESLLSELLIRQEQVKVVLLRHIANIEYGGTVLHRLLESLKTSPLDRAFRRELIEIVLEKGVNLNAIHRGITPLHLAVEVSLEIEIDLSLINSILEHGADINGKSVNLETPLHRVIKFYRPCPAHDDIIRNLLDHPKIELNAQSSCGETPLCIAIERRNLFLINKLLNAGANINIEDKNGHPTFHGFLSKLRAYRNCPIMWNCDYLKILNVIITHIKKLTRLNIFVSEKVQTYVEELSEYMSRDDLALIDFKIDEEIKKLKSEKMDQYTSLYDVMSTSPHSLAKYARNENLLDAVRLIRSDQGYPVFGDIIERQYVRGCRRLTALGSATIALNTVTKMNWPYCCSDRILSDLSDDELKDLTESACVEETRKRSLEVSSLDEERSPKIPRTH